MTVMLDKFFGVHPEIIRSGVWKNLKPGAKDLFIYLMAESERCCTRELRRSDAQISATVGAAARTLCDARKKLGEFGLIAYRRGEGNKFTYVICNPATRLPYPGNPRTPMVCRRRPPRVVTIGGEGDQHQRITGDPITMHGLPGVFDE
ncbi:MAG: hypothetical protein ACRD3E_10855 [Terriglobales bacterium]